MCANLFLAVCNNDTAMELARLCLQQSDMTHHHDKGLAQVLIMTNTGYK
jgi:hypothetical protein